MVSGWCLGPSFWCLSLAEPLANVGFEAISSAMAVFYVLDDRMTVLWLLGLLGGCQRNLFHFFKATVLKINLLGQQQVRLNFLKE